ncbi:MAG: phosphopantothenoylcysteine decarboxylase [Phycisphaeraceae bacterium]|nr:phosphopantothenoylcysteine decarboxylase [Phycisphaeraceae bacterium]
MSPIAPPPRLCITAGPTHEPIDGVRYLANRSSGRLGIAIAQAAADRGWRTCLLLGPTPLRCSDTRVETIRFSSTSDLEALLADQAPRCDCLIMAAAVADYRPLRKPGAPVKHRRMKQNWILELEPTPDLLAHVAAGRRPGQLLVGFALEPRETMLEAAGAKLARKGVDLIVANPLETMDSDQIEATLLEPGKPGADPVVAGSTPGKITKTYFAIWLLDHLSVRLAGAGGSESHRV